MASNIDPALQAALPANTATSAPTPQQQQRFEQHFQQYASSATPAQQQQQTQNAHANYAQASPQPYYPYPTPQTHTPQQPGAHSTPSQSNQPSPQIPAEAYAQHQGDDDADGDGSGQNGDDPKRPRACEACRGLKVRCDQDPNHPELPCKRCAKAGRHCIITAPSRKRQKKADSRVAELEKKLDALTAVLQQTQHSGPPHHAQYGPPYAAGAPPPANMMPNQPPPQYHQQTQYAQQQYAQPPAPSPAPTHTPGSMQPPQSHKRKHSGDHGPETPSLDGADEANPGPAARYANPTQPSANDPFSANFDFINSQLTSPEQFLARINALVSPDIGVTIFSRYNTKLAPHMPAVVFPEGTTAQDIMKEKPLLYASILSAGSVGILVPETCKKLSREVIRAIADCVVCNGAKSLELIQSIQVLALWYKPPERAEQTNFYQLIHMAAVMAIDIGLGKRFNPSKARRGFGGPHAEYAPGPGLVLPENSDTIEARRAWLVCYYLCASASMVLRRPNLVHWTNYMQESLDVINTSPEALPSDKLLVQHIKIQRICEEVSVQFLMDDSTANISISDPKVTYTLNVLENEHKKWKEDIPAELKSHSGLKFFEHVASLYLHEIALHFNHNIDDFKLPFTEESLKSVNNSSEKLSQHQIAALEACRVSAQGVLNTMLNFDLDTVKSLPMLIFFVRCTYALVILIKMYVAITTPGSEISKMMAAESINVDHYLDSLMAMFGRVTSEQEMRPHPKILRILTVLKEWFGKHKENVAAQARGDVLPHPPTTTQQAEHGGLHVLSEAASTKENSRKQLQASSDGQGWTFNNPFPVDYSQQPPPGHPDNRFPVHQQQYADTSSYELPDFDPSNPLLWGSNFQQAMDLNLAAMEGISGGGINGLFYGDGLAPLGFNSNGYNGNYS